MDCSGTSIFQLGVAAKDYLHLGKEGIM